MKVVIGANADHCPLACSYRTNLGRNMQKEVGQPPI